MSPAPVLNADCLPGREKSELKVLIDASEQPIELICDHPAPEQYLTFLLPGVQMASPAMPDIHWGYGFPIGGVRATNHFMEAHAA